MRYIILLLSLLLNINLSQSQDKVYIDENHHQISRKTFGEKWADESKPCARWDSIGKNNIRYYTLRRGIYSKGQINYTFLKSELEKIIPYKIPDSNKIIIEYYYKDDLCSSNRDNNWNYDEIKRRKRFIIPKKKKIEKNNTTVICLFENGIKIKNRPLKKSEYFFMDTNNYFREKVFASQTLCGSYAAIKPNGEILIRNGEYRVDYFAEHLKPENWSLFFNEKQN